MVNFYYQNMEFPCANDVARALDFGSKCYYNRKQAKFGGIFEDYMGILGLVMPDNVMWLA